MLSFFKKNKNYKLIAPVDGKTIKLENVKDETFSNKTMGDGIAIEPTSNIVCAPCNGKVTIVSDTKHAFGIVSDNGHEILVHIGIDTVDLQGEGFEAKVSPGDNVKVGEDVIHFDRERIISKGIDCTTVLVVLNHADFSEIKTFEEKKVVAGEDTVIEIIK